MSHLRERLLVVGPGGAFGLLLLFIGIHNAWDAVSYHNFVSAGGSRGEADDS